MAQQSCTSQAICSFELNVREQKRTQSAKAPDAEEEEPDQTKVTHDNDVEPSAGTELPPCSFWGLVCLILLVKGTYTPGELFGDRTTPPSLVCETVQVCVAESGALGSILQECNELGLSE